MVTEEEVEQERVELIGCKLSVEQKQWIEGLLKEFKDVLSDQPGKFEGEFHAINTSTSRPIRQ